MKLRTKYITIFSLIVVLSQFFLSVYFRVNVRSDVVCPPCKVEKSLAEESSRVNSADKFDVNANYVHESEIGRFDTPEEENCRLCERPSYEKSLYYNGVYVYVDSMTTRNGREIVVVANLPPGERRIFWKGTYHAVLFFDFNLFPSEEHSKELKIPCSQSDDYYKRGIFFSCTVPDRWQWVHDYCYKIQLYREEISSSVKPLELLRDPLLVRQCHKKEFSKDSLAVCVNLSSGRIRFILEWIEFHMLVGVKHFYIYLQPIDEETILKQEEVIRGFSSSDTRLGTLYDSRVYGLLKYYVDKGVVSLFKWPRVRNVDPHGKSFKINSGWKARHREDQIASQNDCLNRYRDEYRWLMMIDGDEYVVPVKSDTIVEALNVVDREVYFGVEIMSWFYKGSKRPLSHLLTESYPLFDRVEPDYRKTIVNPEQANMIAIHQVGAVVENTRPYVSNDTSEIYIAHYSRMKVHDTNPVVTEEELLSFVPTPIGRFQEELKKRVAIVEERIDFDKFGFEY